MASLHSAVMASRLRDAGSAREVAGARGSVEERPGVTLTRESDLRLDHGRLSGRYAAFLIRQPIRRGESVLHSYLILFRWNDWWIKWRITFAAAENDEPVQLMMRLVEALTPS